MAHMRRSLPGCAKGFSLVEIMVALTLSLLLLGAVLQIFISSKASYRMNEGLARLQETGRFAIGILAGDIRMAGFQGCLSRDQIVPNVIVTNPPSQLPYNPDDVIRGQDNLAAGNSLGAVVGSDSLSILSAASSGAHLTGNMTADNANIQIDSNPTDFQQNDILVITDCANTDIFRASSVSNSSGNIVTVAHANNVNTTNRLSKAYQSDAMVMAFQANTYYVADTGRTNEDGDPIYGLYVQRVNGTPVELVDGVENMQVLYGEDTNADGSVDRYVTAGAVTDFTNVLSVRVALLVDSVEPDTTQADTSTYQLLDKTVDPPDKRYLRKVFTLTATARNRELRSTAFN